MKKLLIGFFLSCVVLPTLAATKDKGLIEEDRFYLADNKKIWVYLDGVVKNPPYVSLWTGIATAFRNPKAKSTKVFMTFDCRLKRHRFDARIEYSEPNNKGKALYESFNPSQWWPVEPDTIFNDLLKGVCDDIK
nr:MAG TPA: PROTEIN E ADHESION [Caudoviricetes sp.]